MRDGREGVEMIEPVLSGAALARQIAEASVPPGGLDVWWLGQSGFVLRSRFGLLAIDLYLSEHLTRKYEATDRPHVRMTRAAIRGDELRGLDLILASHRHSDHLDPGSAAALLEGSPEAALLVPEAIRDHAIGLGLPEGRLVGVDAGSRFERAGFRVRAVASAHEGFDRDAAGRHPYLGFVVEVDGLRIYHSGDTLAYDGLAETLGGARFDALFLPINGRDPRRGVPGNMSAAEAVDLSIQLRPRHVVPHHYDMFTFNTVPVGVFEAEAGRLPSGTSPRVLKCGERWELRP